MLRKMRASLIVLVLLLGLPALDGCATSRLNQAINAGGTRLAEEPDSSGQNFGALLPPPSALAMPPGSARRASYDEEDYIRHGKELDSSLPLRNAAALSNSVQFDTNWSVATGMDPAGLGFCGFAFDNLSAFSRDAEVRYGWDHPPEEIGTAWLALADWDRDCWVWHQCTPEGVFALSSFDPYISPTNQLVAMVLMANAEKSMLRWIRLGPKLVTADLTVSPAVGIAPMDVTLDASGSTSELGTTIVYRFDIDEDGEPDFVNSGVPTVAYTESEPGLHNYSVRVENTYGVAATAAAQCNTYGPWTHSWGGNGIDSINAIACDGQEYIYAVGTTKTYGEGEEDVLVLKYNLNGTLAWARCWGGANADIAHAAVFADQSLYVVGETRSFGVGSFDALIQCWDADGNVTWTITSGTSEGLDPGMTKIHSICARGDKLYLAGSHNCIGNDYAVLVLQCDLDGAAIWGSVWFDSTSDVAYAISAFYNFISRTTTLHLTGSCYEDLLYLCYSDDGTLLSSRIWQGTGLQSGKCISVYGIGQEVFIGGLLQSTGVKDALLLKQGTDVGKRWDGGGDDYVSGMLRQGDDIYLCGRSNSFHSTCAGLLLKCTADSTLEDIQLWKSGSIDDDFSAICRFPGSGYLMGGTCASADGGNWIPASDTFSDASGSWTDVSGTVGVFNGETTSPTTAAVDITDAIIDMGGGDTDALVMARAFD